MGYLYFSVLAALASAYVETIRNGGVPCIESAVISMATKENVRAVDEGLALYKAKMGQTVTMPTPDDNTLTEAHLTALKEAVQHFLQKAIFDSDQEYQESLNVGYNIAHRNTDTKVIIIRPELIISWISRLPRGS